MTDRPCRDPQILVITGSSPSWRRRATGSARSISCGIDFAFTLVISTVLEIRIETAFSVDSAGVEVVFDPGNTRSLGPLLDLHKVGVLAATLSKAGTLRVEFQDGRLLRLEPDDRYEACAVRLRTPGGDRRFEFFVLPGGGLAEFDFTSHAGGP